MLILPFYRVRHYMQSKFSQIDIRPERIGNALKTKFLYVPPNQREYSWKDKHVRDLFDDLKNVITKRANEYFLGSIVVAKQDQNDEDEDEKPRVVDGQQRLATALILISSIRDYLEQKGDPEAAKLEKIYILSPVMGDEDRPRLSLNDHDRDYFVQRVLLSPSNPKRVETERNRPTRPSHNLINNAAKIAKDHVKLLTKGLTPEVAKKELLKQIAFLERNAIVIWVEVPDDRSAYTIFETMNDRGLDLSATDLIKNHLFHEANDQIAEAERRWASMAGILESVQESDIVKDFVRHFWISRHGGTRAQELFGEIKDSSPNQVLSMELLASLHDSANKYVALLNPMHGFWDGHTDRTRRNIITLGQLNLKQARPLLLAVIERFPKHEIEKVLRLAISWSVRFLVSGELGSGALESEYGTNALRISEGKIKDAHDLALAMTSIVPTDGAFESAFENAQAAKSAVARYYLRCLELQQNGDSEPENVPNDDPTAITLEHILPEEVRPGEWVEFTEEERKQYTSRIGNMALLTKSSNSDLQSKQFDEKRPIYAKSAYTLTSGLATIPKWTPSAVTERQKHLAKIAVKAWPIKLI